MSDADEEWYYDLERKVAVRAGERGKSDHMMGPYPNKEQAENWKQTVATRNEAWDEDDEEWNGDDDAAD
jgi:hypothetical protein